MSKNNSYIEIQENLGKLILAEGKENFYKVDKAMPSPKLYQYSIKFAVEPNQQWINNLKELTSKGVDYRILAKVDDETKDNIKQWTISGHFSVISAWVHAFRCTL